MPIYGLIKKSMSERILEIVAEVNLLITLVLCVSNTLVCRFTQRKNIFTFLIIGYRPIFFVSESRLFNVLAMFRFNLVTHYSIEKFSFITGTRVHRKS